ncbi:MAG: hypothetical protein LBT55_08125 [Clostridiaceae bacterium]|jgi:hypothetical protein|nr:hypothetical protein [Clostridiaceae bacterium]
MTKTEYVEEQRKKAKTYLILTWSAFGFCMLMTLLAMFLSSKGLLIFFVWASLPLIVSFAGGHATAFCNAELDISLGNVMGSGEKYSGYSLQPKGNSGKLYNARTRVAVCGVFAALLDAILLTAIANSVSEPSTGLVYILLDIAPAALLTVFFAMAIKNLKAGAGIRVNAPKGAEQPPYAMNPQYPGYPINPANAGYPLNPGYPANPQQPANVAGYPQQWGYPQQPGNPAYPAYPGYPVNAAYPANPGYPLNPDYAANAQYTPSQNFAGGYTPPTDNQSFAGGYTPPTESAEEKPELEFEMLDAEDDILDAQTEGLNVDSDEIEDTAIVDGAPALSEDGGYAAQGTEVNAPAPGEFNAQGAQFGVPAPGNFVAPGVGFGAPIPGNFNAQGRDFGAPIPGNFNAQGVVFIREDRDGKNIWRVHRAPSKAAATAFLQTQEVTEPFLFVVVETPEGVFGRDKAGFYKE